MSVCASPVSAPRLPRRAAYALAFGFFIVAAGIAALHPHSGAVFAFNDEDGPTYWRNERARALKAASSVAPAPPPRPQQRSQQSSRSLAPGRPPAIAQSQTRPPAAAQHAGRPAPHHPPAAKSAPRPPARDDGFLLSFLFRKSEPALPPLASAYAPPPPPFVLPRSGIGGLAPAALRDPARTPDATGPAGAAMQPAPASAVCVRLCDGAFFPAPGPGAGSQESCARACPRAPVRLYHMTNGDISTAVSARDGAPYSALPVAMRFASVRDKTCSCGASDHASALVSDPTLRRGDRVMTAAGFRVFKGAARPPYSPRDFHTLAQATYLPAQERASLRSMERAAGVRPQARERDFLAALQAVPPTATP